MINMALLLLMFTNQAAVASGVGSKHCDFLDKNSGTVELELTAIIEFDGLERTFITKESCGREKSIDVTSGFSLHGNAGKRLYDNIILSAKKSSPVARYGVKFHGVICVYKNEYGNVVARIKSVSESRIVLIG